MKDSKHRIDIVMEAPKLLDKHLNECDLLPEASSPGLHPSCQQKGQAKSRQHSRQVLKIGPHPLVAANSCGFLDPGDRISTTWQAI